MFGYDNSGVRRQDRLLDEADALALLGTGEYGFLALSGDEGAYGIPMSYVWSDGVVYFHCAPEGEKLRRVAESDEVCFCVVGHTAVQPAGFTTAYESVLVFGRLSLVKDDAEAKSALKMLLDKYSPEHVATGMKYAEKSFHRTRVLRLDAVRISGKCKRVR